LRAKYKSDLHLVRDLLEARLETDSNNPRSETLEETSGLTEGNSSNQIPTPPLNMDDRRERDDEEEENPFRAPRYTRPGGRRDLPTYNGREDPARYLAKYQLACRANNEGVGHDLLRLFPLALTGVATDWFLDMDVLEILTWEYLINVFIKIFGIDKLLDNTI
jgi:hypothetical protein